MSTNGFPKLRLKAFAPVQERETLESKFWKNFGLTHEEKFPSSPNCVNFCSAFAGYYLVTGSTRVSMYDRTSDKIQKSFSRFTDDAFCGKFRKDGKLIVAGEKTGTVKIFDVQTKAMLRQIRRHSAAVRTTCWNSDGLFFLSGSDDKTVKKWDVATGEIVWDSSGAGGGGGGAHTDYVRTVEANPSSPHLFCSGSYDHSVRLWDSRQSGSVLTLSHGCPVEASLVTPSGALLLSAGGQEVKVWDLIGGRVMHTFSNHQKNVTSLAMDGSGSRILSAGLDGHVKVYSLQTMQVVHGMKFGAPLSCVGVSPDNRKLVVGFVDGNLLVRTRHIDGPSGASLGLDVTTGLGPSDGSNSSSSSSALSTSNRFYKGAGAAAERAEDGMVEAERNTRLRPYEALLKKFSYQKALDAALKTRNPLVIVTVLEELSRRNGLVAALSGRDETSLEPLLSFAAKFISNPRFCHLIIKVSHTILDLYASVLGHSDAIDELFSKLQKHVRSEVSFQHSIMSVLGMLDAVINASAR